MTFGKKEKKRRHPYMGLAILGLAAAGVVSIYNKGKQLVRSKARCMKDMMKREEQ